MPAYWSPDAIAWRRVGLNSRATPDSSADAARSGRKTANVLSVLGLLVLTSIGALWVPTGLVAADHVTLSTLSGNGTSTDPYVITDVHELQAMEQDLDAHYTLGNDIDASVTSGWASGSGFTPIGSSTTAFTGSLTGRGYHITNLSINRPGDGEVGLFGRVGIGGNLTGVWLLDVNVTGDSSTGSLVGRSEGTITEAIATGTVVGGGGNIGGLVGNNGGEITRSYTNVTVDTDTSQTNDVGGLVGYNRNDGLVSNSSTAGDVSITGSGWTVGGVVGFNDAGTVTTSFATGLVSGSDSGGVVGRNDDTVSDSYWDTEGTGQSTAIAKNNGQVSAVSGYTTAAMTGPAAEGNMSRLDFPSTWVETDEYPLLRWRLSSLSMALDATTIANGTTTNATATLTLVEGTSVKATTTAAYSSNDTTVATVTSAGLVTATGAGSAKISATLGGESNSSTLVVDTTPPSISGFTLSNPEGATLNVSFDSDEKLASISVSITGAATATLTSFTQNGSTYTGSVDVGTTGSFTATLDNATDAAGNDGGSGQTDTVTVTGSGPGGMLGAGTASNPYVVTDIDEFQAMEEDLSANYVLGNSIDARNTSGWNGGSGFDPVGNATTSFSGTFDGQNHSVYGLYVDRPSTNFVGLFARTASGATVSNVTLVNANVTGQDRTGTVVGYTHGTISNAGTSGTTSGGDRVGGIAGQNEGTIRDSFSTNDVSGSGRGGGLVGFHGDDSGLLEDSYATGNVTSDSSYAGGLVGVLWNSGTVRRSFSTGSVTGGTPGGVIGRNEAGSTADLYWDTESSGQAGSLGTGGAIDATGLTTTEMTGSSASTNMSGLEFTSVLETTNGYPAFQWEPRLSVAIQSSNSPVDEGTSLDVTVSATNDGASGTRPVTITDFDGDVQGVTFVTLGAGQTDGSVTVSWPTRIGDNGTGTVTVATSNDSDTTSATVEDAVAPPAPSRPDLSADDDSGASNTDDVTNVTTPTVDGTAEAGATLNVTSDVDGDLGTTTADGSGNWSFTPGTALSGGTHAITANATDSAGNTGPDSAVLNLTVDATASTASATGGGTYDEDVAVGFDASGSTDNRGVTAYDWAFGDGATGSGSTPTHTYSTPGSYTATVTVRDAAGNAANTSLSVVIEAVAEESDGSDLSDPAPLLIADLEIEGVDIAGQGTTATVATDESVLVTFVVSNSGTASGTVTPSVTLSTNQTMIKEVTPAAVAVTPGEAERLSVSDIAAGVDPGQYRITVSTGNDSLTETLVVQEPPSVELTTLDIVGAGSAATLRAGTTGDITATTTNIGEADSVTTVTISIEDSAGRTVAASRDTDVRLAPDERHTISLESVIGTLAVGTYTVVVETTEDRRTGRLTIVAAAEEEEIVEPERPTDTDESGGGNLGGLSEPGTEPSLNVLPLEQSASLGTVEDSTTVRIVGGNFQPGEELHASLQTTRTAGLPAHVAILNATLLTGGNFTVDVIHAPDPMTGDPVYDAEGEIALQYLGFDIRVDGEPIEDTPFANETIRFNVSIEHLPEGVTAEDVELKYHVNPWLDTESRFVRATDEYLVFEATVDGLPDLTIVVPEAESSGLFPFELPRIPGDPGPAEAAAAGTTISLGFVLKPFLKDMIATFFIFFERSFRVGDVISWGDQYVAAFAVPWRPASQQGTLKNEGVVKEIGYRSTLIQTPDDAELSVPNALLADAVVAASGSTGPLRLQLDVPIDVRADAPLAKETIRNVLSEHESVLGQPAPTVYFSAFEESRMCLRVSIWIVEGDVQQRFRITDEITVGVTAALSQVEIEYEYPKRVLPDDSERIISGK